ncbi:MAG: branched-chain amino acid transaminase [Gammaproteobacteria bacterium]
MTMADRDGVIWFDGEMVPWRDARVHVLTHTLHYGMGVFEGVRAYKTAQGTAVFRLQDHIRRLFHSAHILQMSIPYDEDTLSRACLQVVTENKLHSAYIRPLCFYGAEGMGIRADKLKVHIAIAGWEWGTYLGDEALKKGIRVKTSSYTRHHVNISMCKAKANGHYINSILALHEAIECGYDEALMLDNEGYVAEGTGENIFIVRDGVVYTPVLTSALEGITRDCILTFCKEAGIELREKQLTRDEVYVADEAFFTGTAAEVTPIRELDNRTIGNGARGPVTEKLQQQFFDVAEGKDKSKKHWLSYTGKGS